MYLSIYWYVCWKSGDEKESWLVADCWLLIVSRLCALLWLWSIEFKVNFNTNDDGDDDDDACIWKRIVCTTFSVCHLAVM